MAELAYATVAERLYFPNFVASDFLKGEIMNKDLFSSKSPDINVFFGLFSCAQNVFDEYCVAAREEIVFIYAFYECAGYEGDSFVIFVKGNELYEVHGSHCSCYGLEGCWEPTKVSFQSLMLRRDVPDDAKKNLKLLYPNLVAFL